MFLSGSKFYIFYLCRRRDALHWKRKGVLCFGVYWITVKQDCAACISEGVLKTVTSSNADFDMAQKMKEEHCLCRRKGSGRPRSIRRDVERVNEKTLQSPKKSLRRTSLETQISPTTVWRILRKRLIMWPYKLQLIQAIRAEYKRKHKSNWRVPCLRRSTYWTCEKSAMKSTSIWLFPSNLEE